MNKMVESALLANHATIGVHWIYDQPYLEKLSKKQSLLFLKQSKEIFDGAKTAFFVYEHNDYSVQGDILLWLNEALDENPYLTPALFAHMLYEHFKPGGDYQGYAEKYSKKQVFNGLIKELRIDMEPLEMDDQQMVGFVPYIAFKSRHQSSESAYKFTEIYSKEAFYLEAFKMLDTLFELIEEKGLKTALKAAVKEAPSDFLYSMEKALDVKETEFFVSNFAGRACPVGQALPVIFHLLYHYDTYGSVLEANALIGGASSDRALLLGAILSEVYDIPEQWKK